MFHSIKVLFFTKKSTFFCVVKIICVLCIICQVASSEAASNSMSAASCLAGIKNEHKRQISDSELFSLQEDQGSSLSSFSEYDIWQAFIKDQTPQIGKDALIKIWKSQRNSILDLSYRYTSNETVLESDGVKKLECELKGRYLFAKGCVLISSNGDIVVSDPRDQIMSKNAVSTEVSFHDGNRVLMDSRIPDSPHVSIDKVEFLSEFYPPNSLLALCMQLDTRKYWDSPYRNIDVVEFVENQDGSLLECTETVSGEECIVITDTMLRVLVSPRKNFSVVKIEQYSFRNPTVSGSRHKRELQSTIKLIKWPSQKCRN